MILKYLATITIVTKPISMNIYGKTSAKSIILNCQKKREENLQTKIPIMFLFFTKKEVNWKSLLFFLLSEQNHFFVKNIISSAIILET
jgi:hypothetical protein